MIEPPSHYKTPRAKNLFMAMAETSSMLTPVRIRGKKKRDQPHKQQRVEDKSLSALPIPKRRSGRPRKSGHAITQHIMTKPSPLVRDGSDSSATIVLHSHHLSALEQLPKELLQAIILLSRNINLPKASSHLGSVLASPLIRTELVLDAFFVANDEEEPNFHDLQSSLLRQKWLTYDFFQHCQKTYMVQQASRIVHQYSKWIARDVVLNNVARMTEAISTYYTMSHRITMKLDPRHHALASDLSREIVFMGTASDGDTYSIILDDEGSKLMVNKPWYPTGADPLWSGCGCHLVDPEFKRCECRLPRDSDFTTYGMSWDTCEIPEKLLHGPWTNERGHFLKLLLNGGAYVNWFDSTSGEVASQGLEDAIREDNSYAISMIKVRGMENMKIPSVKDIEQQTRKGIIDECLEDLEAGSLTIEELTDPHAPWRMPFGNDQSKTTSIGVVPSTKHLKIAVLERGANVRVLKALLGGSGNTDIDCDDNEIVEWALQKRAEAYAAAVADPDHLELDIGGWLLDTLEVVRGRQRKQETYDEYQKNHEHPPSFDDLHPNYRNRQ